MHGVIVGVGNSLRSDDGIGPAVVDLMRRTGAARGWSLEVLGGNPWGLAPLLFAYDTVVLVDAVAGGGRPGEMIFLPFAGVRCENPLSLHQLEAATEIALARQMEARAEVWLAGIVPFSLEFGDGLTPEMEAVLPRLAGRLAGLLTRLSGCVE